MVKAVSLIPNLRANNVLILFPSFAKITVSGGRHSNWISTIPCNMAIAMDCETAPTPDPVPDQVSAARAAALVSEALAICDDLKLVVPAISLSQALENLRSLPETQS